MAVDDYAAVQNSAMHQALNSVSGRYGYVTLGGAIH
jgi:hypothetical protein